MPATPDRSIAVLPQLRAGLASAPVSSLLRLLGFVARLTSGDVATRSDEKLVAAQKDLPRNFLTTAVLGQRARSVRISDEIIPGPPAGLRVRLFSPDAPASPAPGLLYLHGGGWVAGDIGISEWWCSQVAARTGSVVASLAYRLAPRHRFPDGLEDCYRALEWLHENRHRLGIDPAQIGVAGDSAGGNLAAALCLLARQRGGPAIVRQTLIYPALDLTLASPSMLEKAEAPLLTKRAMQGFVHHYLGGKSTAGEPLVSPLFAEDLAGLPPALIQVAEHDPLRDDGWRYAARLREAGVAVHITEYAGAPHGFAALPGLTPLAGRALDEACQYLSRV
ncbi:MAG: putative lipase/esterase [Akkermansiaceae bacterium]|nr:putative lipase/esterase [Akkermansiaceae bacterium]